VAVSHFRINDDGERAAVTDPSRVLVLGSGFAGVLTDLQAWIQGELVPLNAGRDSDRTGNSQGVDRLL
jgi:hypothetical protein